MNNCPTPAELQRLLLGELPEGQAEALELHLAACDRCAGAVTLQGFGDTLAEVVRRGLPLASEAEHAVREDLLARVSAIPAKSPPQQETVDATVDTPSKAERSGPAGDFVCDFLAPAEGPDEIGRLGTYRVLRVLGHGGMGVVFLAEDTKLQRKVALKAMLPEVARKPEARDRFLREARTVASIEHDNIVAIYQVDEDRGVPFLAMPLLQGASLEDWLRGREKKAGAPMKSAQILKLGREVARGLAAAHGRGLIHRDIKPANIWLDANAGGRARILDFGLAKPREQDQHITQSGMILGTPAYMAPEQARGEQVDGRADLWSLGVVLYRLSTGRLPFRGVDTMSTLLAIATQEPVPVAEINPDLPSGLADLTMELLSKEADRRPRTAQEVVQRIAAIEKEFAVQASGMLGLSAHPALPGPRSGSGPQGESGGVPAPAAAQPETITAVEVGGLRKPRWPMLVALAAAGCLAVAAGVVLFLQAPHGTLRIEIDDPKIQVKIDGKGAVIQGADKHDIRLVPGRHLLQVQRGDLKFETDIFVLRKGETATLRVEWFPAGKVRVVQGGKVLGERAEVPPKSTPADQPLQGLEFSTNGAHVLVPDFPYDSTQPLTLEAVVYQKAPGYSAFVGLRGGDREFVLWTSRGERKVGFAVHDRRNSIDLTKEAVYSKPVHLAATWDGSKTGRFFVDGVPAVAVQPSDFFPPDRKGTWLTIGGNKSTNPGKEDPLNAIITQVRISRTARYQKPFTPLRTFAADADTLALYKFDEGSGDVLKDASGNGRHGKIIGAKWVKVEDGISPLPSTPPTQFDKLSAADIPEKERMPWHPPELVGLVGSHAGRHLGDLHAVAVSPDGKWIATGGNDGTVRLWDAADLTEKRILKVHGSNVRALAFSPVGNLLASAAINPDYKVVLWDLDAPDGKPSVVYDRRHRPDDPGAGIHQLAWSPDGKILAAAGSFLSNLLLWSVEGGKAAPRPAIEGLRGRHLYGLGFLPDGKHLAAVGLAGTLEIWQVDGAKPIKADSRKICDTALKSLAISPDGKRLATTDGKEITVWEWAGGKIRPQPIFKRENPSGRVIDLAFVPDGDNVLASAPGGVLVFANDRESQQVIAQLRNPMGNPRMALSRDQQVLVLAGQESYMALFRKKGPGYALVRTLEDRQKLALAAFADGSHLAVSSSDFFRILKLENGKITQALASRNAEPFYPQTLALTPDSSACFVVDAHGGGLRRFLGSESKFQETPPIRDRHPQRSSTTAFSADGKVLAVGYDDGLVQLYAIRKNEQPALLHKFQAAAGQVDFLDFTPDGKRLAVGPKEGKDPATVWNLAGKQPVLAHTLAPGVNLRHALFFTSAGKLFEGGLYTWPKLWELTGPQPAAKQIEHSSALVAAGGRKRNLAVCTGFDKIIVLDLSTLAPIKEWHWPDRAAAVALSPDERHVLVGNPDGTVCILRFENSLAAEAGPPDPGRRAAAWVLTQGGSVVLDGNRTVASLPLPAGPFRLTACNLTDLPGVDDTGFEVFRECRNLRFLTLSGIPITDAALANFAGHKNLTLLRLDRTGFTDAGLAHFAGQKHLTSLDLAHTRTTDAGLLHFRDCPNLHTLDLAATGITSAGLRKLPLRPSRLHLGHTKVGDEGLEPLRGSRELKFLHLDGTPVSDAGLAYLKDCAALAWLDLEGTKVTDMGMQELLGLKKLDILDIKNTAVTAEGIAVLKKALPNCRIEWNGGVVEPRPQGATASRSALRFDGKWTHVNVPSLRLQTDGPLTIEARVKFARAMGPIETIACCYSPQTALLLGRMKGAVPVFLARRDLKSTFGGFEGNLTDGTWHHLAGVWDGKTVRVFVDGKRRGKTLEKMLTPAMTAIQNQHLILGADMVVPTQPPTGYFHGDMAEMRLSKIARYADDFASPPALGKDARTIALYRFDEGKGDELRDASGNGHHGKIVGAQWVEAADLPVPADPDRRAAAWVLSQGGSVVLDRKEARIAQVADLPEQPFRLTAVVLTKKTVLPGGFSFFKGCTELTHLDLADCPVDDEALAHFTASRKLTFLDLGGTQATDAGLAHFKACTDLKVLRLNRSQATETGLAHFAGCRHLQELDLSYTRCGNDRLDVLRNHPELTILDLGISRVTDAGLANLKACRKLERLSLRQAKMFSDAGMVHLQALPRLTHLKLGGTLVGDPGLKHLHRCANLIDLDLSGTRVTADGIDALKQALPACRIVWDGGTIEPTRTSLLSVK